MIKITFENGEEYTEEQYKKDYVRMMDSIRTGGEDIGKKTCDSVGCDECPLYKKTCSNDRSLAIQYLSFSSIKAVHDWAKAHPCVTNRDKIKEVFGINVINSIVVDCGKKESCYAYRFSNIKDKSIVLNPISQYDEAFGDWLNEEYKEPKGENKNDD